MAADVTWNDRGARELLHSAEMRRVLDGAAFTITAHAVPFSGVDTGRLINSMGHTTKSDGTSFVATLGSGAQDGVNAVWYASYHWADRPDPSARPDQAEVRGRKIDHPTRKAPTRPYTQALRQLGIRFTVNPGGFES
jgi:hypothetical protein